MNEKYSVIVNKRLVEAENVVVLDLISATESPLPEIEAGSHIDLFLPNGLIRQYSLCQDPSLKGVFRLGILKDEASRGGSLSAFNDISEGMQLQVSHPKNLFPLLDASHSVLVGGGIGITPLITMAYDLLNNNKSFELHYCAASKQTAAFVDEIKQGPLASYTTFHFKDDGANHREFFDHAMKDIAKDSHLYTCGPNGFMDWIINLAESKGFSSDQLHKEYFQVDIDLGGASFEVVAQQSGKTIQVAPEETILQALAREGIKVELSCEQGVCGTCMCDVLEGEPDHRDVYFTDEEKESNEQILVCCSRSKTPRLVLDI
ncbi:PDR/VanB family oxidoreductase [Acinetobacter sp. YH12239]|uniref:PDR/VanB family oxidoreductase n=1 Tax=Acinetobacter sp. YH12239 TaxID=2601166 RepID=UPI0015D30E47|nr:PDR/VanB family oxidoreductase [Acinetobacter sp. YH12239]